MARRSLHARTPSNHRQRPRRDQQAAVDRLRRRRRSGMGRKLELRPRQQQTVGKFK
jgi:hypothetical protein